MDAFALIAEDGMIMIMVVAYTGLLKKLIDRYVPEAVRELSLVATAFGVGVGLLYLYSYWPESIVLQGLILAGGATGMFSVTADLIKKAKA